MHFKSSGLFLIAVLPLMGQLILPPTDPFQNLNEILRGTTNNKFSFTLDERTLWEKKEGVTLASL